MTEPVILTTEAAISAFLARTGPFEIAIWDFDGVIGDTEPTQAASYRTMLETQGIFVGGDFFSDLTGRTELEIWAELKARHGASGDPHVLRERRIEIVTPQLTTAVTANWFVRPALSELRAAGTCSIIISASNKPTIENCLDAWNLRDLFDHVSASSGRSDDIPKCDRIRESLYARRALVMEDSNAYLRLASELGAVTIGVQHALNGDVTLDATALFRGAAQSAARPK